MQGQRDFAELGISRRRIASESNIPPKHVLRPQPIVRSAIDHSGSVERFRITVVPGQGGSKKALCRTKISGPKVMPRQFDQGRDITGIAFEDRKVSSMRGLFAATLFRLDAGQEKLLHTHRLGGFLGRGANAGGRHEIGVAIYRIGGRPLQKHLALGIGHR